MNGRRPLPLGLYRSLSRLSAPWVDILLRLRLGRGKEQRARIAERKGVASHPRPAGRLVWIHGASVGETLSILPLVETLVAREADMTVLLTSTTVTAARIIAQRAPARTLHQFVPFDLPHYVARFLDHWRPDAALFVESEIWPNTLKALRRCKVPCALVNARLSERSARRWAHAPATIRWLLGSYETVLAQSQADADRLCALGARGVSITGNLKLDVPAPPVEDAALATLRAAIGGRALFLAASTHPGEEILIAQAHARAAEAVPGLLTIIAPRHPERGTAIAQELAGAGLPVARRAAGDLPTHETQIYIADTLGEMGLFYRLADLAFMGGSLVCHGGQNPIEPAKLATAILHGPHIFNFADIYAMLDAAGGGRPVASARDLAQNIVHLLAHNEVRSRMSKAAREAVESTGGALAQTLAALQPIIARRRG